MKKKLLNIAVAVVFTVVILFAGVYGSVIIYKNFNKKSSENISHLGVTYKINQPSDTQKKDLKTIIYENQKLVMCIEIDTPNGKSIGSGFLYDEKGDIITNAHVVNGTATVNVKMADTTIYKGTVIGKGTDIDVAVVRVPDLSGMTPMKICRNRKAEIGDEVLALGSPLGLQNTATIGIISGVGRTFNIDNYIYKEVYQISAPISQGNSGGPLLDKTTGEVIGINSAKIGEEIIGFSIPINQVIPIVDKWIQNPSMIIKDQDNSSNSSSDEESLKFSAEYLIKYYYDCINSMDFLSAYALFGSDWQSRVEYEKFRKGYTNTLSVRIININSKVDNDNLAKVNIEIEAVENVNNIRKASDYVINYDVGYENKKLKILNGEAKEVQ